MISSLLNPTFNTYPYHPLNSTFILQQAQSKVDLCATIDEPINYSPIPSVPSVGFQRFLATTGMMVFFEASVSLAERTAIADPAATWVITATSHLLGVNFIW